MTAQARTAARVKVRPRTGEARKTNQPLKIDRLPSTVHDAINRLYWEEGKTWLEIEALSAEPFGEGKPGFVNWDTLPIAVLELFPEMRLPHSNLHRWWDIRRRQVQQRTMQSAEEARVIAQVFAKAAVTDDESAILNAARDLVFTVVSESGTAKDRMKAVSALTSLAEVKQKARSNDIKERNVAVIEQELQIKLDEIKRRTQDLMEKLGKGDGTVVPMTKDELLAKVGELYGLT